ncbi:MAG: sigma 54-interacting transcriptional regulator [Planctomycetaceae bacterium]|nr:sigma 54-interacting transcriptional regulator [Planctomycetaceae bacterium]
MRPEDLHLKDLLEVPKSLGPLGFAGQRVLLVDALAQGLLRRELIGSVGERTARCILTRFGYAHGWRTAEGLERTFPWDSPGDWRRAGGQIHGLQGIVVVDPLPPRKRGERKPEFGATWRHSYEAEQHRLHLGPSKEPVCWSLCGFASGYLSRAFGRQIIAVEEACAGRGDAACRMIADSLDRWGDAVEPHLAYYEKIDMGGLRTLQAPPLEGGPEPAAAPAVPDLPPGVVARSEGMLRAVETAIRVAAVDTTVLVSGESGVGKETLVRLVHRSSPRRDGPFVAVNCGAVAETLLESELFGHAKGAFTGAERDRAGLFEEARGGTLFLDEIGETSPSMQVKLLRALQEREVRRVGESRTRRVDVRVVAATNRDLRKEVKARRFREDLYYRLRVFEIGIPPLRDRREDILPLAREFLSQVAGRLQRGILGFTPMAADALVRYEWPGNVRELANAVEHAVVLCQGSRADLPDLPGEIRSGLGVPVAVEGSEVASLEAVERKYVLDVLAMNRGHRERTAKHLGIGVATLYRMLRRFGVPAKDGG